MKQYLLSAVVGAALLASTSAFATTLIPVVGCEVDGTVAGAVAFSWHCKGSLLTGYYGIFNVDPAAPEVAATINGALNAADHTVSFNNNGTVISCGVCPGGVSTGAQGVTRGTMSH